MNSVKSLLLLALILAASSVSVSAQQSGLVTTTVLKANNPSPTGPCPVTITFAGIITMSGPGEVRYTFTRSDGATGPVYDLLFKEAGTQEVSTTWTLGNPTSQPEYPGWQAIRIVYPNLMESSHETGSFRVSCREASTPRNEAPVSPSRESTITQVPFQVVFRGFTVNRQTHDDDFNRDGWGDEVYNSVNSFVVNLGGQVTSNLSGTGLRIGDVHAGNRILGGSAGGVQGGFRDGDSFPLPNTYEGRHPVEVATDSVNVAGIPGRVFDGSIGKQDSAIVIFVSLWEWDNDDSPLVQQYRSMLAGFGVSPAIVRLIKSSSNQVAVVPGSELGLPQTVTLGDGPFGLGEANSRPIGMVRVGDRYSFDVKAIVLTYEAAMEAATTHRIIEVPYADDQRLRGNYSLFFEVVAGP